MLEALLIMVIARVPERLVFHVDHGERGRQGEQQQRAGGGWRAGERVSRRAGGRAYIGRAPAYPRYLLLDTCVGR